MDNLNLKVHHVGVCCKDIDQTGSLYSQLGFSISETFKDEFQKVYVKVCTLGNNTVELVAPLNETSPIQKLLQRWVCQHTIFVMRQKILMKHCCC